MDNGEPFKKIFDFAAGDFKDCTRRLGDQDFYGMSDKFCALMNLCEEAASSRLGI